MEIERELKVRMNEDSGCLVSAYPDLYKKVIHNLLKPFRNINIDKVVAPEAKGLFYGPIVAYELNKPFVAIFKSGRVPKQFVLSKKYKDYSKKIKSIDVGKITIKKGENILFIDDVFETGESAKAAINIIEKLGGNIVGISIVYNKMNNREQSFFKKFKFNYLVKMEK